MKSDLCRTACVRQFPHTTLKRRHVKTTMALQLTLWNDETKSFGNLQMRSNGPLRITDSWIPHWDVSHPKSYTVCPGGNVPDFGRMFLTLKCTDLTQNTYIQSWTVTEIMGREKYGLLAVPRTVPVQLMSYPYTAHIRPWVWNAVNVVGLYQNAQSAMLNQYFNTAGYLCAM